MEIKKIKSTSPGKRNQIKQQITLFSKNNNILKNNFSINKNCGRSKQTGRITVRHKGGGKKLKIKKVTNIFSQSTQILLTTLYDYNCGKLINVVFDPFTKKLFFTTNTKNTYTGFILLQDKNIEYLKDGNSLAFQQIPAGSLVHSIIKYNKQMIAKSPGTFGQIIQKNTKTCKIRVPSGQILEFLLKNIATLGVNSNQNKYFCKIGKAGINRNKNKRPSVRGIAMNPVDHPHGGRSNGGKQPTTPWGKLTKGVKTKK